MGCLLAWSVGQERAGAGWLPREPIHCPPHCQAGQTARPERDFPRFSGKRPVYPPDQAQPATARNDGATPNDFNDTDSGPNDLLNFPALNAALLLGDTLFVSGSINTQAGKVLRVEFFASPSADPTAHGEGQTFLGALVVNMGGSNTVNFAAALAVSGVQPGQVITATATDELGNTSEFSVIVLVT
jgi:hypothetical protein